MPDSDTALASKNDHESLPTVSFDDFPEGDLKEHLQKESERLNRWLGLEHNLQAEKTLQSSWQGCLEMCQLKFPRIYQKMSRSKYS